MLNHKEGHYLNSDHLEQIHDGTVELLKSGVCIQSKEALDLLSEAGAIVNQKTYTAKIPENLIYETLRTVPDKVVLRGRSAHNDIILGNHKTAFTSYTGIKIIDPYTGIRRDTSKKDVAMVAKFTEALDQIDFCFDAVVPRDVKPQAISYHAYEQSICNTTKPVFICPIDKLSAETLIEMATLVNTRKEDKTHPLIVGGGCSISPLTWPQGLCESLITFAEKDLPFLIFPLVLSGATAPVSLAGTMVIHNAEIMIGIVLSQIVKKGSPVVYGSASSIFDFKSGIAAVGSPESTAINACAAKLAQFYRVPSLISGGWSNSKISDLQGGFEKGMTLLTPMLSGADSIFGAGTIDSGITFDLVQYVADNEFIKLLRQLTSSLTMDTQDMALDLMKEKGAGSNYLMEENTLNHMKKYQLFSDLVDRNDWNNWENQDKPDFIHNCHGKMISIRDHFTPEQLPYQMQIELKRIIDEVEQSPSR